MRSNFILGIFLIIASALLYTQVVDLPVRSAMFPKMVLWGAGITGLLMLIDAAIKAKRLATADDLDIAEVKSERIKMRDTLVFQIMVPGGIMLLTFMLLTVVGFYLASAFLVFVIYCYHDYRIDPARLKRKVYLKGCVFAFLVTLFMYLVFTLLLGLPAPSGVLF
ncbi:tripartite tricarboxylate transporter TctB family protein [Halomonas sp. ML-15]|uniref:tripartite tricarboxylate transporter TctB family protein n=1 Tax=Halomonas sp. ML-15 TaxID=2773305 RepID=UPI0017468E88|nr:tripartite tricarboxylate transporter TctB family protein [Halomonas sp. ML-15]MBD3897537.1 tripartite tricarboxylate transporter TctB family protein [Halomonas sp. ML-15]